MVDQSRELAVVCGDDADRQGTDGARRPDCAENVGGLAAGREGPDCVVGAKIK